ncbi:hypothetical protein ARMGADRAFT_1031004 [Armillaria gallica]|uniref:Uncharacterized protein n=1 Tax=Armillaria gallica TaxID=47427 RepID=A0A2H3DC38_ARMGA|nr:hypothetical protein ARMGADRAFT_1031004 [Armillaria gallica]
MSSRTNSACIGRIWFSLVKCCKFSKYPELVLTFVPNGNAKPMRASGSRNEIMTGAAMGSEPMPSTAASAWTCQGRRRIHGTRDRRRESGVTAMPQQSSVGVSAQRRIESEALAAVELPNNVTRMSSMGRKALESLWELGPLKIDHFFERMKMRGGLRKRHVHVQVFDCDLNGLREKADKCDGITNTKAATSGVCATDAIAPTFNKGRSQREGPVSHNGENRIAGIGERYTLSEVPLHIFPMTTLVRDRLHRKATIDESSSRPVNSSCASRFGVDIELGGCKEVLLPGSGKVALNIEEKDLDNGRRTSRCGHEPTLDMLLPQRHNRRHHFRGFLRDWRLDGRGFWLLGANSVGEVQALEWYPESIRAWSCLIPASTLSQPRSMVQIILG